MSFGSQMSAWKGGGGTNPLIFAATLSINQYPYQEIGVGLWKAVGDIEFTATYANGPATGAYISHAGWTNLTMTEVGFVGPTLSAETEDYPVSPLTTLFFTLNASKGSSTATSTKTVTFLNRRYYGVNSGTSLSNSDVLALSKEFCPVRANTHVYDCSGAGTYIWICYPASFGEALFYVGPYETTFVETVQDVTNDSGFTESYYCFRSLNLQHGPDITVEVI